MNQIKRIREGMGMKQVELAKMARISSPYLYDLENNKRGAKPDTLLRIAEALGVSPDELLKEDSDEPLPDD